MALGECGLCGALQGDDADVARALVVREAEERGYHPAIYPLVLQLNKIEGLTVLRAEAGDPSLVTWPYVQMGIARGVERSLENLAKSLALSNANSDVHWVLELEYQHQLVVTLKPRFHRVPAQIGSAEVIKARADLTRICQNLQRDVYLSWWRT